MSALIDKLRDETRSLMAEACTQEKVHDWNGWEVTAQALDAELSQSKALAAENASLSSQIERHRSAYTARVNKSTEELVTWVKRATAAESSLERLKEDSARMARWILGGGQFVDSFLDISEVARRPSNPDTPK